MVYHFQPICLHNMDLFQVFLVWNFLNKQDTKLYEWNKHNVKIKVKLDLWPCDLKINPRHIIRREHYSTTIISMSVYIKRRDFIGRCGVCYPHLTFILQQTGKIQFLNKKKASDKSRLRWTLTTFNTDLLNCRILRNTIGSFILDKVKVKMVQFQNDLHFGTRANIPEHRKRCIIRPSWTFSH